MRCVIVLSMVFVGLLGMLVEVMVDFDGIFLWLLLDDERLR